jgi:hypothetical protein
MDDDSKEKMSLEMVTQIATTHCERPFRPSELPDDHVCPGTTTSKQKKLDIRKKE